MTSRRRLALAVKRRDGDLHCVRDLARDLGGHVRDSGLEPVDLEVGPAELVGKILSAQPLSAANLLDSTRNKRALLRGHSTHISDSDIGRKPVSPRDRQPRDTVGDMPAHELSWDEADRWIRELGKDWDEVLKLADVRTPLATLKMRWTRGSTGDAKTGGSAPKDRAKVRKALEVLERKNPTSFGQAIVALERWVDLGAKIAQMPDDFLIVTRHLEQLAAAADMTGSAKSTIEAARDAMDEAMAPFRAQTFVEREPETADPHAVKHRTPRDGARKPTVSR